MTATQSKAVSGHVIDLVAGQLKKSGHGASTAAVGSVLQRLATCSNGEGIVDQSIHQLAAALLISEPVIKRVLCAATDVGVLVTLRKGGGPKRMPTQRQMRLDYHRDGDLYLSNEPRRQGDPSSGSDQDPDDPIADPSAQNTDPQGIHTQRKNKDNVLPRTSPLTPSQVQRSEEAKRWLLSKRKEAHRDAIRNPAAWEQTVLQDINNTLGDKINSLINVAPTAPITLIASCAESGNSAALGPYVADVARDDA